MRTLPPTFRTLPAATGTSVMRAASSGARPGCSTPPATSMLPATVPLPPSVPPVTSIGLACEPTTESLPALTVLVPCHVLSPVRNRVPSPRLVRLPVVDARVACRLAARADREVRRVDRARVRRQAVGPALGDLGRLPRGRLVGVLLLARPDGDVGDVVRPHVAVPVRVDVGRPEQLARPLDRLAQVDACASRCASSGTCTIWPRVGFGTDAGGVADRVVLAAGREQRVQRLLVGHVREALHDQRQRRRRVRAGHRGARRAPVTGLRHAADDLHRGAVDVVGRGRDARPLRDAALVERLLARDEDRPVGVERAPGRGVDARRRVPASLELGQEVRRGAARRRVDVAAVAGRELDDRAGARDVDRAVEPVRRSCRRRPRRRPARPGGATTRSGRSSPGSPAGVS